jgi:leucyl-tRNA synthetase
MEWTEAGVAGAYRFTQRVFRLAEGGRRGAPTALPSDWSAGALTLRRAIHGAIKSVTEALDSFAFNVALARLYELANAIAEADRAAASDDPGLAWARAEAVEMLARLFAPMMPHLAEEVYAALHPGAAALVAELPWPEADPALTEVASVTVAVQVMGKLRATITLPVGTDAATAYAAAEADPNVARALADRRVVKRIHVPDRIVNYVVAG